MQCTTGHPHACSIAWVLQSMLLHQHQIGAHACNSFMSVDVETKSSRLLIFFSLAFRVTAPLV